MLIVYDKSCIKTSAAKSPVELDGVFFIPMEYAYWIIQTLGWINCNPPENCFYRSFNVHIQLPEAQLSRECSFYSIVFYFWDKRVRLLKILTDIDKTKWASGIILNFVKELDGECVFYVKASSFLHLKPNIDVSMLLVQKTRKKSNKKTDIWFPLYCVRDQLILDFHCGQ